MFYDVIFHVFRNKSHCDVLYLSLWYFTLLMLLVFFTISSDLQINKFWRCFPVFGERNVNKNLLWPYTVLVGRKTITLINLPDKRHVCNIQRIYTFRKISKREWYCWYCWKWVGVTQLTFSWYNVDDVFPQVRIKRNLLRYCFTRKKIFTQLYKTF